MKIKTLALGLALAMAAAMPAAAQRGPGNWELLGQEKVGLGADRDVIKIGHNEDYFRSRAYRKLRFIADGGEVRMRSIRLHYINGHSEEFNFEQNLKPGREIDIDLRGERSYLRQIEMFYKGKFGISIGGGGLRVNQPVIKVLGENVRFGPGPGPGPAPGYRPKPGWQLLGQQQVGFGVDRDVIRINPFDDWRNRGYDRLHFVAENNDLHLISVRVVYQNGFGEDQRIDRLIRAGDDLVLDLPGRRSFLREIEMVYRSRPGFAGRATVSVFGESARRR